MEQFRGPVIVGDTDDFGLYRSKSRSTSDH
jgi:hypothetical protein